MTQLVGEGVLHVSVDDSDVGANLDKAGKEGGKRFSSGFSGAIKGLVGVAAVAVAGTAAIGFAKGAISEARESQKVSAASAQVIKATGGAANLTTKQVGDLATAISNKTGVDDEAIQSGENLLLTFANVRNEVGKGNDVFSRATQAASDLSAAGFGSISGASVQLGKALNDPLKGISALGRSGVTFTAQQQAQIKTLVESGKTLQAQKIILGAVEGQVGGVAAASATMGEKASTAFGNIKESIGTALLPALDSIEGVFVNHIAPAVQDLLTNGGKLAPLFHGVHDAVGAFKASLTGGVFASDSNSPVTLLAFRLGGLVKDQLPKLTAFWKGQFLPALQSAGTVLRTQVLPVLKELGGAFISNLLPVLAQASATFRGVILPAVVSLVTYVASNLLPILLQIGTIIAKDVLPTLRDIALFIYGAVYPAIVQIVKAIAVQLKPTFDQLVTTLKEDILPTISDLIVLIHTKLLPALEPIIKIVLKVVGVILILAATILGHILPVLIRLIGFILKTAIPIIAKLIVVIVQIIGKVLEFAGKLIGAISSFAKFYAGIVKWVAGGIQKVLDIITGLPGKILGLGKDFLHAGSAIIGKFLDGLKNAGGAAKGIVSGIWNALRGLINGAIDSINNSLEFSISVGFGKHITINAPDIPHLARGTASFGGGLALVGEHGPELAALPRGTAVLPADRTAAALGGVHVHVYGDIRPHDYRDVQREFLALGRQAALGGPRALRAVAGGTR